MGVKSVSRQEHRVISVVMKLLEFFLEPLNGLASSGGKPFSSFSIQVCGLVAIDVGNRLRKGFADRGEVGEGDYCRFVCSFDGFNSWGEVWSSQVIFAFSCGEGRHLEDVAIGFEMDEVVVLYCS